MTAQELIDLLRELDPKTPVLINTLNEAEAFFSTTYRDFNNLEVVEDVKLDVLGDGSWGDGQHVRDPDNKYPEVEPSQAVILSNAPYGYF